MDAPHRCLLLLALSFLASCSEQQQQTAIDVGADVHRPTDSTADVQSDLAARDSSVDSVVNGLIDLGQPDVVVADAFPPPALDDCITDASPGQHSFDCDGLVFDVSVPPQCITGPCGLVVDVHGLSMNAAMQDANTGMRALGIQHGYVVIQPNAPGAPPLTAWRAEHDAKVHAFMKRAIATWHLDSRRLHFTGFSQGGRMSWRFLCKYGAELASAAPAADCGVMAADGCFGAGRQPPVELPILFMHGTKDALINFACATPIRDQVVATWKMTQQTVVSQDAQHVWTRHVNAAGTTFEFVQHDYAAKSGLIAGHCFPGSSDINGGIPGQLFGFGCTGNNAFTWGAIVMQFFIAHPKGP